MEAKFRDSNDWTRMVSNIFLDCFDDRVQKIERFGTGLSMFVFDVWVEGSSRRVIRIASGDRKEELSRGIDWHKKLEVLGLLLPQLYACGEYEDCDYAIYERLPGSDLEVVYGDLSDSQLNDVAMEIAKAQKLVAGLNPDVTNKDCDWQSELLGIINRSRTGMERNGAFDLQYLDEVEKLIRGEEEYFGSISPVHFLYDLNVRNVLIDDGKVTGFIDVDDVFFGDPLLAIGRGKMLLLLMGHHLRLIDYWTEFLKLDEERLRIIDVYALLYCIRFMGTLGLELNGNLSVQTDVSEARNLAKVADSLLKIVRRNY